MGKKLLKFHCNLYQQQKKAFFIHVCVCQFCELFLVTSLVANQTGSLKTDIYHSVLLSLKGYFGYPKGHLSNPQSTFWMSQMSF